jgi:hypothetical protein
MGVNEILPVISQFHVQFEKNSVKKISTMIYWTTEFRENGAVKAILYLEAYISVLHLVSELSGIVQRDQKIMQLNICECHKNRHREIHSFLIGINKITLTHIS